MYLCIRKREQNSFKTYLWCKFTKKNNMNKVVKIEKILIDKDEIPKIMKIFGCGKTTVYNALAYRSNSQQAQDIRSCALYRYGAEPVKVPQLVSV